MATTPAFFALQNGDGTWVPTGYTELSNIPPAMVKQLNGTPTTEDASGTKLVLQLVGTKWVANLPTASTPVDDSVLQTHHFAPVRAYNCKVERPYSSTASSAQAPGVGGRVDWDDFVVERNCDAASPVIFKNCCNGAGFHKAMLAYWLEGPLITGDKALVLIEFCSPNISSYEIIGGRWAGEKYNSKGKFAEAREVRMHSFIVDGMRTEKVAFWHTQMSVKYLGAQAGWNGAEDVEYTPPWPNPTP